uniref:Uncharacterized protein n=1 Tax=Oryza meridionalis TaxID=40149 RepID=A0A0E0E825_9ORYZ
QTAATPLSLSAFSTPSIPPLLSHLLCFRSAPPRREGLRRGQGPPVSGEIVARTLHLSRSVRRGGDAARPTSESDRIESKWRRLGV